MNLIRTLVSIAALLISIVALGSALDARKNARDRVRLFEQLEKVKPVAETQPRFHYKQKCVIVHGFYRGHECTPIVSRWSIEGRVYDVTLTDPNEFLKQLTVNEADLDTAEIKKLTGEVTWNDDADSVVDGWIETRAK